MAIRLPPASSPETKAPSTQAARLITWVSVTVRSWAQQSPHDADQQDETDRCFEQAVDARLVLRSIERPDRHAGIGGGRAAAARSWSWAPATSSRPVKESPHTPTATRAGA
ncbi:hypothetical protein [Nonomuraea jiangxiensis]|uniref:hypothetical protein n=1 Tax=Nonomuraea jiangxiensis TaxID=633440 RepID=UPI000B8812BA|nr:hypothetical protein [Nonomuraea jiangxiensis]